MLITSFLGLIFVFDLVEPGENTIKEEDIENEAIQNDTDSNQEIIIKVNENFVRDRQTNTVTCPMGYILKQKATINGKIRYANRLAYRNCTCKCTIEAFKVVAFSENKDIVKSKFFAGKETVTIEKTVLKATADLSLSFLAYNMKRAINMVGVNNLIAKMQAI